MAARYVAAQLTGAAVGVYIAHAMFAMPVFEISEKLRDGPSQWLAEFIATFGLLATIAGSIRFSPAATPMLVGLYITAAYWFTASTVRQPCGDPCTHALEQLCRDCPPLSSRIRRCTAARRGGRIRRFSVALFWNPF